MTTQPASSHQQTAPPSPDPSSHLFQAIEAYDWLADTDFQSGLQAILTSSSNSNPDNPNPDSAVTEHLTLRARCFYFSRKNQIPPIDFDAYTRWRRRHLHDPAPDVTATIDTTTTTPSQAPAPTPSPPSAIVAGTAPETTISSASTTSPSQIPPSESETTALTSPTPTPTPTSTTTTNNTSSPQPDLTPLLPPPSSNSEVAPPPAPAPYPTSFSAIVELISSGKPIQGIKEIPKTVLEGQGSLVTVKTPRKKPWEKQQQGREQC